MRIDDLINDINIGHEIEFKYNGIQYSICPDDKNCCFNVMEDPSKEQIFKNIEDLVENLIIEGKKFKEIFSSIEEIYVF